MPMPIFLHIYKPIKQCTIFASFEKNRDHLTQNRYLRRIRIFVKIAQIKSRLELCFLKLLLFSCGHLRLRQLFWAHSLAQINPESAAKAFTKTQSHIK